MPPPYSAQACCKLPLTDPATLCIGQRQLHAPSQGVALQNARKALEPPKDPSGDDGEEELLARRAPLGAGVPKHWGRVRAACLEAVLSIAMNTNQHADVWDAASRLLSDHHE